MKSVRTSCCYGSRRRPVVPRGSHPSGSGGDLPFLHHKSLPLPFLCEEEPPLCASASEGGGLRVAPGCSPGLLGEGGGVLLFREDGGIRDREGRQRGDGEGDGGGE
jgi:hypothetical protein